MTTPIQTPDGLFHSIADAARYYEITLPAMRWRIKNQSEDFYVVTDPELIAQSRKKIEDQVWALDTKAPFGWHPRTVTIDLRQRKSVLPKSSDK